MTRPAWACIVCSNEANDELDEVCTSCLTPRRRPLQPDLGLAPTRPKLPPACPSCGSRAVVAGVCSTCGRNDALAYRRSAGAKPIPSWKKGKRR